MKRLSTLLFIAITTLMGPTIMRGQSAPQPPDPSSCVADNGVPCYSPQQLQTAYGLTPLINSGYNGAGQTIVIIESYGSPTIEADLKAFDQAYNLPDPPSFQVLSPLGTVAFDPTDNDQVAWAFETTLDVQMAHAMAPGANIIVLTSPVDETQGVQGLPEFLQLEQYALDHHLGNVISQSWGTAENTLFNPSGMKVMFEFQRLFARAAAEHVTVLAGAGDSGSSNVDVDGNFYSFPTVLFPASSPLVLAVGGTTLQADSTGSFQSEIVWNDVNGATGGGVSQYFRQPAYQRGLPAAIQQQLAGHRGLPDVVFNADPVFIYVGFFPDDSDNGFYTNGGTSEATPAWAGIIAIANQYAGESVGFFNPSLYTMGLSVFADRSDIFRDVIIGNNAANGVAGYDAATGWDLASGWGSPNNLLWTMRNTH